VNRHITTACFNVAFHLSAKKASPRRKMNDPQVHAQCFFVYDAAMSSLRSPSEGNIGALPHRGGLGKLLAKGLGSLKADRARKRIFYVKEGCVQVRQTVEVDRFYHSSEVMTSSEPGTTPALPPEVREIVEGVFQHDRDALFVVGGYQNTNSRSRQMHGGTLELPTSVNVAADSSFTFVPPPKDTWGLMLHVVEYALEKSAAVNLPVSTSSVRIQLDNVVDAIIPPASLKVKFGDPNQGQRMRQQYSKLLALTSASTLDVEDDAGVARITDQTVCSIRSINDFFHVINCFSATAGSKPPPTRGNQKGSTPAHCLTTLSVGYHSGEIAPRKIHFLELADSDWTTTSKEDQSEYSGALDNLTLVLHGLSKQNDLLLDSITRKFTLTHVLCSQLRTSRTDFLYYGHTAFATSLLLMKQLSKISGNPIRTVLHGPDLEGELEVDIELRNHLEEIQRECEALQTDVDDITSRRNDVDSRMRSTEEEMARLDQRRATMLRMSFAAKHRVDGDGDDIDLGHSDSLFGFTGIPMSGQNRDIHLLNAAKCYTLKEELRDLQRTHVKVMKTAQKQLELLIGERARSEGKVSKLLQEMEPIKEAWRRQCAQFAKEKDDLRKEFHNKSVALLESRRSECEKKNEESRKAQSEDAERSRAAAEEIDRREKEEEALHRMRVAYVASDEHQRRRADDYMMEQQLRDVQSEIAVLDEMLVAHSKVEVREEAAVQHRMHELEQAAAVLNEFAFRMTSLLSTVEKRMHHTAMTHITVHELQQKHTSESLEAKASKLTRWLQSGGLQSGMSLSPIASQARRKRSVSPSMFIADSVFAESL
jgi:hypothetical protein